jgi:hypothetical protein
MAETDKELLMEQAAAERRSELEQLNQKKEQIQKGRESLNNALKNIKTRFGFFIFGFRQRIGAIKKCGASTGP